MLCIKAPESKKMRGHASWSATTGIVRLVARPRSIGQVPPRCSTCIRPCRSEMQPEMKRVLKEYITYTVYKKIYNLNIT